MCDIVHDFGSQSFPGSRSGTDMDFECQPSTSCSAFVYKSANNSTASPTKRRSLTDEESVSALDSLPEDVVLELFSYLNSSDISNLCVCSPRIVQICRDHRLWRKIHDCCDGSKLRHDPQHSIFTESTTHIKISSGKKVTLHQRQQKISSLCLRKDFFRKLEDSPNLQSFILENHSFNITTFSLDYFPRGVTELRLNGSHIFRTEKKWNTVFLDIDKKLPNLEILDLSRCYWMRTPVLSRIFECVKIKTLILFGCRKLEISMGLRTLFGAPLFSSLETLDLRKTEVTLDNVYPWPRFKKLRCLLLDPVEGFDGPSLLSMVFPSALDIVISLTNIETLVVRNDFEVVTDSVLKELRTHCKSLKYLDVTGTRCTAEAVIVFQNQRPDVELLHESLESDCY